MTEPARTIFKLIAKRRTKQVAQLTLIMLGLFMGLGLMAGAQLWACKREHPGREWVACLAPLWRTR